MDFHSFSFLDLDGFSCVQLRKVCCWSSCVQTGAVQPSIVNQLFPERFHVAPATVSFCPTNRTRRFSPACLELLVARLVCPRTNPCSCRSFVAVMRQRHIGPCPKRILPSLMHCSCKKCLPMLNCLLYAVMHAWVCAVSLRLALSQFAFSFTSRCKCINVRKSMHGAVPIKSSVWCSCCSCSNLSWSSLVPKSQNCLSSCFAVMTMMRLESMLKLVNLFANFGTGAPNNSIAVFAEQLAHHN